MSPDELLEYCSMQLNGLNTEMTNQMNQQTLELQEREAVENAQTALESFGTTGPQNGGDFQKCLDAINKAAASLPPGDPVAEQLTSFGNQIAAQYGYQPPQTTTTNTAVFVHGHQVGESVYQETSSGLAHPPANNDWQGTTDTLGNMADGIKSNSEIQMLSLQDLVSQQQQAVQLASGMMSTEDQTLESEAKNIGG
jgi:hypothetical protein